MPSGKREASDPFPGETDSPQPSPPRDFIALKPPKKKDADKIQQLAANINESWHKCRQSVLEVANLCFEASLRISPLSTNALMEQLTMSPSTFSKLATVGAQRYFYDPELQRHLPPNWTSLYILADAGEDNVRAGVREERITPKSTRVEIEQWKEEVTGKRPARPPRSPPATKSPKPAAALTDARQLLRPRRTEVNLIVEGLDEREVKKAIDKALRKIATYKIIVHTIDDCLQTEDAG